MMNNYNKLYSYSSLEQLRKIQEEKDVYSFVFAETKNALCLDSNRCIDITSLILLLRKNSENIYSAEQNLKEVTESTIIIVEESIANDALRFLPHIFDECVPYFEECIENNTNSTLDKCFSSKTIYTYNTNEDLQNIIEYAKENNIPITTFSQATNLSLELAAFSQQSEIQIIDLTSISYAIKDNQSIIYIVEQFLNNYNLNINAICLTSQVNSIIKHFPLYYSKRARITELLPELEVSSSYDSNEEKEPVKIIPDLSKTQFVEFCQKFNHGLVGHTYFKKRFLYSLNNFITLNQVEEKSIFSVFLFGKSGIGKTEVARVISESLKDRGRFIKINFENYSSQDALNNLIGSSRGYIGCEEGELSKKLKDNTVGVILCDEFEKTTRPVFSFFLEMLEEGHFTDSMAREYDLNGYIVIFTSNIQNESEYKKTIPPELQTRFDLVCEFQSPTIQNKNDFIDLLIERTNKKLSERNENALSKQEISELKTPDYGGIESMRDIKKAFNNHLAIILSKRKNDLWEWTFHVLYAIIFLRWYYVKSSKERRRKGMPSMRQGGSPAEFWF